MEPPGSTSEGLHHPPAPLLLFSPVHPLLRSFSSGRVELYDFGDADGDAPTDLLFESQNVAAAHPAVVANLSAPLLAWHAALPGGPVSWSLRLPHTGRAEKDRREEARALLERNGLGWAADLPADELSHGLHKGIELCRALLMRPRLLLLDEPAAGLSHGEVEQFSDTIKRLREEEDITIVIVEHHMGLIAALTDRVVVLDHGRVLMEGTAAQAQSDPRVIEAYIGKEAADDAA